MNTSGSAPTEHPWSWHRWILFIGIAFAAHVGFIFAFGDRKPVVARTIVNSPAIQFTAHRSEREQLDDPTLFALPHPNGFAGAAWLPRPQIEFAPFRWTEAPRLLALSVAHLGATFRLHRETNTFERLALESLPPPLMDPLQPTDLQLIATKHSMASLGGELAQRGWLNAPTNLQSWPASDILTNTVVQVWVKPDGQVFSSALLLPGSGSKEADLLALKIARAARFAPRNDGTANLSRGTLMFAWHTLPQTNSTPATP